MRKTNGIPDGWTEYGLGKDLNWQRPDSHDLSKAQYEKLEISDSQRYKLCGNGGGGKCGGRVN